MQNFPTDWYWVVADDESRAYSSASGDYVRADDSAFQAWLSRGDAMPTRIASEAELGEVLAQHSLRPTRAAILDAYKDQHARKLTLEIVAKVLLSHENRIRALEGKQAVTAAQFRGAIKELM